MATKFKEEIYNPRLVKGQKYQGFVAQLLLKLKNIVLTNLQSKYYQGTVGENMQGFEIKFDNKMADTGNVFIEIQQRYSSDEEYWDSSLKRDDNAWMYCIGNYNVVFFFTKKILRKYLKEVNPAIKENSEKTGKGFLLTREQCLEMSEFYLENKRGEHYVDY